MPVIFMPNCCWAVTWRLLYQQTKQFVRMLNLSKQSRACTQ